MGRWSVVRGLAVLAAVASMATMCEEERPFAPCDGVTCSERGACVVTDGGPVCECDEGMEPWGLSCVPEGTHDDAGSGPDAASGS